MEQALRIPQVIRDKNAGNEWDTTEVAAALPMGSSTPNFFYLTAAARDYGLTEGTRYTSTVKLTPLGRRAVYPSDPIEEIDARREAFLRVETFRGVLEYYKGDNLPEKRFLGNVLQTTFNLDPRVQDEFVEIFKKNCKFVGIGTDYSADTEGQTLEPATSVARTVGVPSSRQSTGRTCFVAMPFTERDARHSSGFFDEVLTNLFSPALVEAGFEVRTARQAGSDLIHHTIVNELLDADLALVDLTEHNPNVLFELGLRMALGKPIVLVRASGTGPIFDVDNMLRVVEYDPNLWKSVVEKDIPRLTEHVIGAWENRETNPAYIDILRRRA